MAVMHSVPYLTIEELLTNLYEAVEGCLSVDLEDIELAQNASFYE
jgi:predicted RNase H-like HicB family nuclease